MRIIYFEPFSGISGDMALGALLDLGIEKHEFLSNLSKLGLSEYEISIEKGLKLGISGTNVNIAPHEVHEEAIITNLAKDHSHQHEHNHSLHEYHHSEDSNEHSHFHRSYKDIVKIISESDITERAKHLSLKIFEQLAIAEGKIHGIEPLDVTFHEVGAVDSIVDIVGVAICLDMLDADKILCSSVNVGGGMVKSRHGLLPVPAPATLELLKGLPMHSSGLFGELTTPTGAAILAAVSVSQRFFPSIAVQKIGYGLGKRNYEFPNCLRVTMGTIDGNEDITRDSVKILETNIDNMDGEIFGYVIDKLFELGALDVWFTPIQMKKNRPATKLSVLCLDSEIEALTQCILRETTTLGIRILNADRVKLERSFTKVDTRFGEITLKVSRFSSGIKAIPEYEECKKLAEKSDVPLRDVYEAAKYAYNIYKSSEQ